MALTFIEPELWVIEILHCGNRDFRLFLLRWPWPWPNDLHIRIPWRYAGCANMNFLRQGFSTAIVYIHTYRQTRPKLYTTKTCLEVQTQLNITIKKINC